MQVFNNKQYSWCDISIAYGGRIIEGVTSFEFTEKQEKKALYGRGNKPHQILRQKRTYEGKITIWQSELEAMTREALSKDLLGLKFDVVITYVPTEDAGGEVVVDVAKNCEITEVKKAMTTEDGSMTVELPLIFTDFQRQL